MDLLVTERLLLRPWAEADLPAFFDIYSRDEVTRWLGPLPRRSVADLDEARRGLERWRGFSAGLAAPLGLWAIVRSARVPSLRRNPWEQPCCCR